MNTGTRVLVVDDEPLLLSSLRRLLARARPDIIVVYASSAQAAEWQLESTSLRFVMTDLRMHADAQAGLRVVKAARAAQVPVAVVTSAMPHEIDALSLDGVEVIPKAALSAEVLGELLQRAFAQ